VMKIGQPTQPTRSALGASTAGPPALPARYSAALAEATSAEVCQITKCGILFGETY
jgi:hypothetical protein